MASQERARTHSVQHDVGLVLRAVRRARRISQEQLAFETGVTQGSISNYETGRYDIPLSVLIAICHALETPISDVLDGVEPRETRPIICPFMESPHPALRYHAESRVPICP